MNRPNDSRGSSAQVSETQVRVRYAECDMQGRVFNAHYLTWVDMAHTDAINRIVGDYRELVRSGVDLVVAAAELQFRRPAGFDDRLLIRVHLHEPGTTSLRSDFTITRDGELIAEATMTHVCVDAGDYGKRPWPEWIRARLRGAPPPAGADPETSETSEPSGTSGTSMIERQ